MVKIGKTIKISQMAGVDLKDRTGTHLLSDRLAVRFDYFEIQAQFFRF